jgi:hypothetical protein
MASPFSVLGILRPELLATVFPAQLTTILSKRISFLLATSNEMLLITGSALVLGNFWRNGLLVKAQVSTKDFDDVKEHLISEIAAHRRLSGLIEPLSDIAEVIALFRRAEFKAVVGWGWNIIDRTMKFFGPNKKTTAIILGVQAEYDEVRNIRNRTVHEGYVPSITNAIALLVLFRKTMIALSRTEVYSKLKIVTSDEFEQESTQKQRTSHTQVRSSLRESAFRRTLTWVPIGVFLVMFVSSILVLESLLKKPPTDAINLSFVWGIAWTCMTLGVMLHKTKLGKAIFVTGFFAEIVFILIVFPP